jgi:D-3-phosphoglycerate dehydrogenase
LGASTEEAEDNCAKMAVRQVMDYLENGNITNSVNYPACNMGICTKAGRITVLHKNVPNMISSFTAVLAGHNINISDMLNRSKSDYAYTMLDIDEAAPANVAEELEKIEGVIRVRVIR